MIAITVRAMTEIAEVMGRHQQIVSMPEGAKLLDLLDTLEEMYGQKLSAILHKEDSGKLRPNLIYLLNGRNVEFQQGLETLLKDGDDLFFLAQLGGG